MKHVELTHNPYLNKTDITIDDNPILEGPIQELVGNDEHPHVWFPRFFPVLHDYCNDDSYKVSFIGKEQDFIDLSDMAERAKSDLSIDIVMEYISIDLLILKDKISKLNVLFHEAKRGPIEEFKTEEIDRAFEHALAPEIEIYVLAPVSAGKSTLINAFLGQDLQPTQNMACTATISRIEDHDNMDHFEGRACYEDGREEAWIEVSKDKLREWNNNKVPLIELRGNIPMIKSDNIRLVLVDTPSTNISMNPQHKDLIMEAIMRYRKKMIVYVLDAMHVGTNDDQMLLRIVSEEMRRGGWRSHDRFIFVLNKIDLIDPENEGISSVIDRARQYLECNGITNPNIYPISANLTRLIRKEMSGIELARSEMQDVRSGIELFTEVGAMDMTQYMPLSPTVKKRVQKRIDEAKKYEDLREMAMLYSGVPIVEEVIQEYLIEHALLSNVHEARMSFEHILVKHNTLAKLDEELKKNKNDLDRISKQLEEAKSRYAQGKKVKLFKAEIDTRKLTGSEEYIEKVKSIEADFYEKLNEFEKSSLVWKMTNPKTKDIVRELESQAKHVSDSIQVELEERIKSEVQAIIDSFRENYVAGLIGDLGEASSVMVELSNSMERMFETSKVALSLREIMSRIALSKKPLLPFSPALSMASVAFTSYEYKNFPTLLRKRIEKIKNESEKIAEEVFEDCKNKIIKQVEDIDFKIANMIEKVRTKTSSKGALEKSLKEREEKKEWLVSFRKELDSILPV